MTVETLKAAHEFILPGLVRACVKQLGKMISRSNVLFIFANVRFLCNDLENLEVGKVSNGYNHRKLKNHS